MGLNLYIGFDTPNYQPKDLIPIFKKISDRKKTYKSLIPEKIRINAKEIFPFDGCNLEFLKTYDKDIVCISVDYKNASIDFDWYEHQKFGDTDEVLINGHRLHFYCKTEPEIAYSVSRNESIERLKELLDLSLAFLAYSNHNICVTCTDVGWDDREKFRDNMYAIGTKGDKYLDYFRGYFKRRLDLDVSKEMIEKLIKKYTVYELTLDDNKIISFCNSLNLDHKFPMIIIELKNKYNIPLDWQDKQYLRDRGLLKEEDDIEKQEIVKKQKPKEAEEEIPLKEQEYKDPKTKAFIEKYLAMEKDPNCKKDGWELFMEMIREASIIQEEIQDKEKRKEWVKKHMVLKKKDK